MRFWFFQVNFFTDYFFPICGLCCEDGQLPSFVARFSTEDDGWIICGFSCILEPHPNIFLVLHDEYVKPMPWWHSSAQIFDFVSAHFSVPSISSSNPEIWTTFAHTAFPLGFPTPFRQLVLPSSEAAASSEGISPDFNFTCIVKLRTAPWIHLLPC